MKKLAVITTHPIQYYAPVFKLLQERKQVSLKVFYTWGKESLDKHDPGFDRKIKWDIPLLEGYPYEWMENTSKTPGSHHFKGIVNPKLIRAINMWQPDALLVFGWGYHSHLKAIRHFKDKIPVYFRGDSNLLDEPTGFKAALKHIFLKWVYSHVNHAFYVGINNKAYFKKYGLKESQLSFAPHAVDNERFALNRNYEARHLRSELNIKDTDLVILFAGKLEEKKDPVLLLKAFLELNLPACHLLFTGNGPLEKSLKEAAIDKGNIHFIDFKNQQQMPVILQCCDIFCLSSRGPQETWGLVINEAMACGKAVLASDRVGCAADLVKINENGYIFRAGSIEDLKEKLGMLALNRDRIIAFGDVSRRIIKDWNFTMIAIAIENKLQDETH